MLWTHVFCLFMLLSPAGSRGGILFDLVKDKQEKMPECQDAGEKCSLYRSCCGKLRCIVNSGYAPYCANINGARDLLASPMLTTVCVLTALPLIYSAQLVNFHVRI